jgi:short-subunit dehydrogenase
MSKEKLPKVLVIGHTRGIGKSIYEYYDSKGYKVKGLSRSNGFHLCNPKKFYKYISLSPSSSTSGTNVCFDKNIKADSYIEYSRHKKKLIKFIEKIQQSILDKPLNIYDVCPDVVDTKMSRGLWMDYKKLKPSEVSKAVQICLESNFNINRIVIQKKC